MALPLIPGGHIVQEAFTYRPIFNRNRVVLFFHPRPSEIADLIDLFQEQGFITNVAINLSSLSRLSSARSPDAIIALAEGDQIQSQVVLIKELSLGTRVYLLTDDVPELVEVARAVRSGALYVFAKPFHVTEILLEIERDLSSDLRGGTNTVTVGGLFSLSAREREVLEIIINGGSNKEAAKTLHISPRTIEVHRSHVMRKLGAKNTAEMVRIALGR